VIGGLRQPDGFGPGRSVKFPRVWSLQTPPSDDRRLS
jgi:hypothetical protein